jgi:hypothetical protein
MSGVQYDGDRRTIILREHGVGDDVLMRLKPRGVLLTFRARGVRLAVKSSGEELKGSRDAHFLISRRRRHWRSW